jgi:hypothetical protein
MIRMKKIANSMDKAAAAKEAAMALGAKPFSKREATRSLIE